MSERTGIQWTDHTFNPWWGCTKISPGCAHCYAETLSNRFHPGAWGPRGERRYFGDKHWNDPVRWNRAAAKAGIRARVFCSSMADVFEDHESAQGSARARLFALVESTPMLDWQLLTKRPENVRAMVPVRWLDKWPANAWIGTSVERQRELDERLHRLAAFLQAVKFLSVEPLLEPVDLCLRSYEPGFRPDWVIVGGESGAGARQCDVEWIRSIVEQCKEAEVACFVKQLGPRPFTAIDAVDQIGTDGALATLGERPRGLDGWTLVHTPDGRSRYFQYFTSIHPKGGDPSEWPEDLRVRQFPEPAP